MSRRVDVADYHYTLPPELVALTPGVPRDSARLLVYDRASGEVAEDTFRRLPRYLPAGALLVFNQTKVIPARLPVRKPSGGVVQLLLVNSGPTIRALSSRKLTPGIVLAVTGRDTLQVVGRDESLYVLKPNFSPQRLQQLLARYGHVPLPPYLKASPLTERQRKEKYQTIFAKESGSVAAPTASLHFTSRLLNDLHKFGIDYCCVTLHVNLGTFAPVTEEQLQTKQLHAEHYEISAATAAAITRAKQAGRPIIAVGTTVARTLESAADAAGRLHAGRGVTRLFIQAGYRWRVVDGLITNFHVPGSSLLMLVAAMIGREKLMTLYQLAMSRKFRFFSFGDGMLIK